MNIRALVRRISARVRARVLRGRHGRRARSGLQAWEAFDEMAFDNMVEKISQEAEEDAEDLAEALRNLN